MTVSDALRGVLRLGLDTGPVISFVEREPLRIAVCRATFLQIDSGRIQAFAGTVTLAEVLIKPLRTNDSLLATDYRDLLTHAPNITLVPISATVAERAADLRARYNLKTADALQVAAALTAGCDAFLTADRSIQRVVEIQVIVVDDLTI